MVFELVKVGCGYVDDYVVVDDSDEMVGIV